EAADHGGDDVAPVGCLQILQEPFSAAAAGAQGEGIEERDQEDADRVVPVEELEAVALGGLVGVGPGPPADGARDHHQHGQAEGVGHEHVSSSWKRRVNAYNVRVERAESSTGRGGEPWRASRWSSWWRRVWPWPFPPSTRRTASPGSWRWRPYSSAPPYWWPRTDA